MIEIQCPTDENGCRAAVTPASSRPAGTVFKTSQYTAVRKGARPTGKLPTAARGERVRFMTEKKKKESNQPEG